MKVWKDGQEQIYMFPPKVAGAQKSIAFAVCLISGSVMNDHHLLLLPFNKLCASKVSPASIPQILNFDKRNA